MSNKVNKSGFLDMALHGGSSNNRKSNSGRVRVIKHSSSRSGTSSRSSSVTPSQYSSRESTPTSISKKNVKNRKAQNNIKWYQDVRNQRIMAFVGTVVLITAAILLYKYFGQNSNNVINSGAENITSTATPTPMPTPTATPTPTPAPTTTAEPGLFGKIFGTPAATPNPNPCAELFGHAKRVCERNPKK